MPRSSKYVLNVVQNPRLLEIAYDAIERGFGTIDELEDETGMRSQADGNGTLDQALEGLLIYQLVGKTDFEYAVEPLAFDTGDRARDFRMSMLHNVSPSAGDEQWAQQAAVNLTYRYLLGEGIQFFQGTSSELISNIDRYHQEVGYEPRNSQGERQRLNPEKFNHWRNQAEFLGLIHPTGGRSSTYTVAPEPDLILAAIEAAAKQAGDGNGLETRSFVDWMDEHLLQLPLTSEREFTEPIARTLYDIADRGSIEFVKRGDVEEIGLHGVPIGINPGVVKNANYLRVRP